MTIIRRSAVQLAKLRHLIHRRLHNVPSCRPLSRGMGPRGCQNRLRCWWPLCLTVIRGCGTVLRKYLRNLGTHCQQHRRTGRNRSEPSEPFRRTPLQLKHRMGYMGPEISRPLWLGQRPLLEQATGYSNTCCTLCYAHLGCHTISEPERRVTLPTRPDNRATRLEDGMYLTLSLACHEGFRQHHLAIALKAHLPPEKELLLACTGGP